MNARTVAERVVVLHGLWMPRHVMTMLVARLRRHDLIVDAWGYQSRAASLEANAAALARHLAVLAAERLHVVAHSYGGVVTLGALALLGERRVKRVVLLGSPIAGSAAGARLARADGWRVALGETAHVWREGPRVTIPAGIEVGAIAGIGRVGLGRLVTRYTEPNDGVVRVSETKLPGLADHLVLDVSHSAMVISARVADQVASFLRHGRFRRGVA